MSIRLPLKTVLDYDDVGQTGVTSVAGGVAKAFLIPQDTDNVVVKFTASVVAGTADVTFQTSDDGGTTYYDVARTSLVSNANNTNAQWLSIPVVGAGVRTAVTQSASVISAGIGAAAASTLAGQQVSGLPILGQANRIFIRYSAAVSSTDLARVKVLVNSQSATA